MKFQQGDKATIVNVPDDLQGIIVTIRGIFANEFYIISRGDGEMFFNGFECLVLTEHCLELY